MLCTLEISFDRACNFKCYIVIRFQYPWVKDINFMGLSIFNQMVVVTLLIQMAAPQNEE